MAKKKKPEEHENLERWLVSYADFMTLLFATFVVLYALSQINVNDFKKMEDSIKRSFNRESIIDGNNGIMDNNGENILSQGAADSMIDSLLMEYISPRYEQESYEQIKREIDRMTKSGELDGVQVEIDDRGLVINIDDKNILFASGSAALTDTAKAKLEKIGKLIVEKFAMHTIRVEGHTDNVPAGGKFPSNWELSAARSSSIVRFLISRFKILPDLFTVVGYADTRPKETGKPDKNKDRRVEIIVQRNQYKKLENYQNSFLKMNKSEQQRRRNEQLQIIKQLETGEISELEEDVKHTSGMEKEAPAKLKDNTQNSEFLNETKRINELSEKK